MTLASVPFELPQRVTLPVEIPTLAGALFLAATVWTGGERLTAFGQNENNAAMFLGGGLIVLLGIGFTRARLLLRPRLLVVPGCVLIAYAVVETGSRGGLLALAAGLITLFLTRGANVWARVRSGALAVVTLVMIAAFAY